jgi:hypothetical protein
MGKTEETITVDSLIMKNPNVPKIQFGEGNEAVYLYYFPSFRKSAEKIGGQGGFIRLESLIVIQSKGF